MLFTNGGTIPLLISRDIPCLHRAIRVVKPSQVAQVKILSGSRFTYSGNTSEPLTKLKSRSYFWSELQSEHLKPMELSKCHPITVNPLKVRVSHKHPSTLTNFLPKEHSIHTRYIYQEIDNSHMTNNNKLLGEWEGKTGRSWPSLTTVINYFFERSVLNDARILSWSMLIPFCPLPFTYIF